jgi:hypothetical protein
MNALLKEIAKPGRFPRVWGLPVLLAHLRVQHMQVCLLRVMSHTACRHAPSLIAAAGFAGISVRSIGCRPVWTHSTVSGQRSKSTLGAGRETRRSVTKMADLITADPFEQRHKDFWRWRRLAKHPAVNGACRHLEVPGHRSL